MSWKRIQRTKTNQAGNRIQSDMRQVTDECCQCNERQITQWSQKVFYCMAKRQQEIHVPGKMNDACVKEERCDERQSTESRRLRFRQLAPEHRLGRLRRDQNSAAAPGPRRRQRAKRADVDL